MLVSGQGEGVCEKSYLDLPSRRESDVGMLVGVFTCTPKAKGEMDELYDDS